MPEDTLKKNESFPTLMTNKVLGKVKLSVICDNLVVGS